MNLRDKLQKGTLLRCRVWIRESGPRFQKAAIYTGLLNVPFKFVLPYAPPHSTSPLPTRQASGTFGAQTSNMIDPCPQPRLSRNLKFRRISFNEFCVIVTVYFLLRSSKRTNAAESVRGACGGSGGGGGVRSGTTR